MNRKNLLYLNLSVDEKDVSLGFAKTWTDQFSKNFDNVDIITLNKPLENIEYQNVKIYGIAKDNKSTKFNKYKQIKNIIQKLTTETNYDLCFSHMSPLLLLMTKFYGLKKFPTILWYTHPKPKEFSKKIVLIMSLFFCNKVVTASNSSFPYKSNKLNVVGHAMVSVAAGGGAVPRPARLRRVAGIPGRRAGFLAQPLHPARARLQPVAGGAIGHAGGGSGDPGGAGILLAGGFSVAGIPAAPVRAAAGGAGGGRGDGRGRGLRQRWLAAAGSSALRHQRYLAGACILQPAARGAPAFAAVALDSATPLAAGRTAGFQCQSSLALAGMAGPARGIAGRASARFHALPDQLRGGTNPRRRTAKHHA